MPTVVSIYSMHAGCLLRLLNCTDCYEWIRLKNVWLFVFKMHLVNGITNGGRGGNRPPLPSWMWKPGPRLACILVFTIRLVFRKLLFFAFFGVSSGDFGFWYSHPHPDSLLFLNFFSVGLASGLPSAKFPLTLADKSYMFRANSSILNKTWLLLNKYSSFFSVSIR